MKINDIFEQEFEEQTLRFQLVELNPNLLTVQAMDITPPVSRSGNMLQAALPKAALATLVNGEYVTMAIGNSWAKRFATFIYNRITARDKSFRWLNENMDVEEDEAKAFVELVDKKLNDWEVRYMQAIVRWAYKGEIDPENERDMERVKGMLLSYFAYLKEHKAGDGEKLKFANLCFMLIRDGERDRYLWSLKEVEQFLRPWA